MSNPPKDSEPTSNPFAVWGQNGSTPSPNSAPAPAPAPAPAQPQSWGPPVAGKPSVRPQFQSQPQPLAWGPPALAHPHPQAPVQHSGQPQPWNSQPSLAGQTMGGLASMGSNSSGVLAGAPKSITLTVLMLRVLMGAAIVGGIFDLIGGFALQNGSFILGSSVFVLETQFDKPLVLQSTQELGIISGCISLAVGLLVAAVAFMVSRLVMNKANNAFAIALIFATACVIIGGLSVAPDTHFGSILAAIAGIGVLAYLLQPASRAYLSGSRNSGGVSSYQGVSPVNAANPFAPAPPQFQAQPQFPSRPMSPVGTPPPGQQQPGDQPRQY